MYCKNCGKELIPGAAVCTQCGVAIGNGSTFCHNCGNQTIPGAAVCTNCGAAIGRPVVAGEQKSKMVAGLLAIFIGSLGIHNFYLGFTKKAVIQLLLCLVGGIVTCGIASLAAEIWAIVDAVYIFTGKIDADANGVPLKD